MTHSISMFFQGKVCGPCLRAGLRVQATHKIGEEALGDAPGVIRHGLTQYVCCHCFSLMMGPLAQQLGGVGMPGLPRLVPVYGVLGEKLVGAGTATTQPLDHPVFDAIRPQMDALREHFGESDLPMDAVRSFLKHGGAALDPMRCTRLSPELVRSPLPADVPPTRTRIGRKERELRESMANLSSHLGQPLSAKIVSEESADEENA